MTQSKIEYSERESEKIIQRFMENVDVFQSPENCWEWQGPMLWNGYGKMDVCAKMHRAHRISYVIHNGEEIPDGMVIMHTCDNRRCVNPLHLKLGTQIENLADCKKKGRLCQGQRRSEIQKRVSNKGESHYRAKLTKEDVLVILKLLKEGNSLNSIAKKFNMNHGAIRGIKIGRNWAHIPRENLDG